MALQHSQLGLSLRTTAAAIGVCEERSWLARPRPAGRLPQRLHDHSSKPFSGRARPASNSKPKSSPYVATDDHSRLAFGCLLPDERTKSVLYALRQALFFYSAYGIHIQQVLTDRDSTYRSQTLRHFLRAVRSQASLHQTL